MIDMHVHVVEAQLPGSGPLGEELHGTNEEVAARIREQMHLSGTTRILGMGRWSNHPDELARDPLGVNSTLELAREIPGLHAIGIMNPFCADREHLQRVEKLINTGMIVALKGYLGYVHAAPSDPGYRPYYELAERHKLPVIFHTGDTYSPRAKLKYSHPLGVDEVAVDHPYVNFVLAHVGNPWMTDAAEIVYKNFNVWTDMSGLLLADEESPHDEHWLATRSDLIGRLKTAFRYAERPNRFLYGSDWPLAPMAIYRDIIAEAIPPDFHEQVFVTNSALLFRLGREI